MFDFPYCCLVVAQGLHGAQGGHSSQAGIRDECPDDGETVRAVQDVPRENKLGWFCYSTTLHCDGDLGFSTAVKVFVYVLLE